MNELCGLRTIQCVLELFFLKLLRYCKVRADVAGSPVPAHGSSFPSWTILVDKIAPDIVNKSLFLIDSRGVRIESRNDPMVYCVSNIAKLNFQTEPDNESR